MSTTTSYDFWSPAAIPDPYPIYDRLRQDDPVYRAEHSWFISRYRDVAALLLDRRLTAVRGQLKFLPEEERARFPALIEANKNMILFLDPPTHTRLRGLVAQAFSARRIEGLRPRIQEIVDERLDQAEENGEWDLMDVLANPLPGIVIAELIGVPTADQAQFKQWANDYAAWLGSWGDDAGLRRQANQSVAELSDYLRALAAERRRQPEDDLLTALVQAEEEGSRLSETELIATSLLILVAGNETTTNLIGNGILTLLRHPDELERLRSDPELLRAAIEELLRFEGPVQFTARIAIEPIDLDGQVIQPGDGVHLLLGAANRDPEQFPDPHRLDLGRRPNRHVGFGHGIHFCLGAPLARAQGQIAIDTIVRRFPRLELATGRVEWRPNPTLRGLQALHLRH